MVDFRHKFRPLAGGHMTKALTSITYASIVSSEKVRIAQMIAALKDLELN